MRIRLRRRGRVADEFPLGPCYVCHGPAMKSLVVTIERPYAPRFLHRTHIIRWCDAHEDEAMNWFHKLAGVSPRGREVDTR